MKLIESNKIKQFYLTNVRILSETAKLLENLRLEVTDLDNKSWSDTIFGLLEVYCELYANRLTYIILFHHKT